MYTIECHAWFCWDLFRTRDVWSPRGHASRWTTARRRGATQTSPRWRRHRSHGWSSALLLQTKCRVEIHHMFRFGVIFCSNYQVCSIRRTLSPGVVFFSILRDGASCAFGKSPSSLHPYRGRRIVSSTRRTSMKAWTIASKNMNANVASDDLDLHSSPCWGHCSILKYQTAQHCELC